MFALSIFLLFMSRRIDAAKPRAIQHYFSSEVPEDALINAVRMSSTELLGAWVPSDWEAKHRLLLSNANPTESGASDKNWNENIDRLGSSFLVETGDDDL